jgi:RsiW-degrading membrane proteinase PrsW (M82 family)
MYLVILGFIALGSLLVWYLLKHDHGRSLPVASLWLAFGFGILANILAGFLELRLFPKEFWLSPHSISMGLDLLFFLGIGFLEESVKFVPLALYIYRKPYFKEHTDGVIYFAICGLTFGLGENILYTMSFGVKVGIARLILTPFLHAAATSILGYYLVSMKINSRNRKKFILACLIIPVIHGLYDFGLFSDKLQLTILSLMLTLLLSLGLFLYFMSANDLDKKAAMARAGASPQNFCGNCGKANIHHALFCEYCGNRL